MIVKVLGLWEVGYNYPLLEHDLFHFPMREFGVNQVLMAPISGIKSKVTEVASIEDGLALCDGLVQVFVDEKGETPLAEFEHPENAVYILGKASTSTKMHYGAGQKSVRVETPLNSGMLWSHQAISIVLYDRFMKNGSNNNRQ